MAMSIAFIPLSAIRTDDILSSLQQLFLDFSYHYTSKRAVYIQLKQSLPAKLAKNFKIIQGKLEKKMVRRKYLVIFTVKTCYYSYSPLFHGIDSLNVFKCSII